MATLDQNRATFVRKAYREYEAKDLTVRTTYPAARSLTLTTNLNAADAQALADKMLADAKKPMLAFEVTIEGTMELDRLVGQNPTAIATLPRLETSGRNMRIVSVRTDYETNTTTLTVRG
ncbi:hypothetical protein QP179_10040 [Sphingomonas aurantiaca]|uniref:hypothetical protein n=1 Tax=Sphingomonas aurantiaca TaxID=185949 RepID=UPI002FE40722